MNERRYCMGTLSEEEIELIKTFRKEKEKEKMAEELFGAIKELLDEILKLGYSVRVGGNEQYVESRYICLKK